MVLFAPPPVRVLDITLAGTKIGEARGDGTTFSSRLELGKTVQASTVVRDADGYTITIPAASGNPEVVAKWAKGKVSIVAGKAKPVVRDVKPTLPFGNLHPFLSEPTFAKVDWAKRTSQKFDVFLVDALAPLPITVTPLAPRGSLRYAKVGLGGLEATYVLKDDRVVAVEVASQRIRWTTPGMADPFVDPLAKYPELSRSRYVPVTDRAVRMTLRDGVELVADVVRPKGDGRFPVILSRTPYGRAIPAADGDFWARRGYVFVAQDVRGRGDSGGAWDPFVNEAKDGYDAVEWAAKQPWSDGNVGMIGASYGGLVQWSAASENPPHLRAIIPQVSPPGDGMRNIPYEFGHFMLGPSLWWGRIVADKDADMSKAMATGDMKPAGLLTLPLADLPKATIGRDLPFWNDWLRRETLPDWSGWNYSDRLGKIRVPALHVSGWWDGDGIGTHLNWQTRRAAGIVGDRLVIGPWTHAFNTTRTFLGEEYGDGSILELDSQYLRWFDTHLKGREGLWDRIPAVRIFVKGDNRWVGATDWPLPDSVAVSSPLGKGSAEWTYDPARDRDVSPKPTTSLRLGKPSAWEGRFSLPPVAVPTRITGPISVTLRFRCSAPDTSFVAALYRERADGSRWLLGLPGTIRASYRNGLDRRVPIPAGQWTTVTVRPWDTAHRLAKGERLGVAITSSAFPQTARNLGTMDPILTAKRIVPQKVTIDLAASRLTYRRG